MKTFTYSQYIKSIHTLRLNAVMQLAEQGEKYELEIKESGYSHDRIMRNILKKPEEIANLINNFLDSKIEIEPEELVEYNNKYIMKKYKSKNELIYKLKNKDIFFLIKQQSALNNNTAFILLNYCIDIIQEWIYNNKNRSYPIIVPIVIYTGDQKWKTSKKIEKKPINNYNYEQDSVDIEYNLIDINKISKQTLLEQNTILGDMMLIEKSKNRVEFIDALALIIKTTRNKEKIEQLVNIIKPLLDNTLEDNAKTNKKVGEENQKIMKNGELKKQKEIVKNMINKKIDDNTIIEITGIKKIELDNIKNTLKAVS